MLKTLARLVKYMGLSKRHNLMNAFCNAAKFNNNYCPIIWIFHSRSLNNKINRLHMCCLRMIYNYTKPKFEEVLVEDNCLYTSSKYSTSCNSHVHGCPKL